MRWADPKGTPEPWHQHNQGLAIEPQCYQAQIVSFPAQISPRSVAPEMRLKWRAPISDTRTLARTHRFRNKMTLVLDPPLRKRNSVSNSLEYNFNNFASCAYTRYCIATTFHQW